MEIPAFMAINMSEGRIIAHTIRSIIKAFIAPIWCYPIVGLMVMIESRAKSPFLGERDDPSGVAW